MKQIKTGDFNKHGILVVPLKEVFTTNSLEQKIDVSGISFPDLFVWGRNPPGIILSTGKQKPSKNHHVIVPEGADYLRFGEVNSIPNEEQTYEGTIHLGPRFIKVYSHIPRQ